MKPPPATLTAFAIDSKTGKLKINRPSFEIDCAISTSTRRVRWWPTSAAATRVASSITRATSTVRGTEPRCRARSARSDLVGQHVRDDDGDDGLPEVLGVDDPDLRAVAQLADDAGLRYRVAGVDVGGDGCVHRGTSDWSDCQAGNPGLPERAS